jgi:hypothetical protein
MIAEVENSKQDYWLSALERSTNKILNGCPDCIVVGRIAKKSFVFRNWDVQSCKISVKLGSKVSTLSQE